MVTLAESLASLHVLLAGVNEVMNGFTSEL
jgi:hypothetical protein